MSQVAAYERVEPTRGFVLVGKYLMSGTRVSDVQVIAKSDDAVLDVSNDVLSSFKSVLNGNFIQDQTKVPVSPNVHYFGNLNFLSPTLKLVSVLTFFRLFHLDIKQ